MRHIPVAHHIPDIVGSHRNLPVKMLFKADGVVKKIILPAAANQPYGFSVILPLICVYVAVFYVLIISDGLAVNSGKERRIC